MPQRVFSPFFPLLLAALILAACQKEREQETVENVEPWRRGRR